MKYLAGLTITEAQFAELRALCTADHSFPPSWKEWSTLAARAAKLAEDDGLVAKEVPLDIEHFKGWCRMVGIVPCIDALRAYAIVMRSILDASKSAQPT